MKKVYTEDPKKLILDRYWAGEKVSSTSSDTGIAKSTLIELFKFNSLPIKNFCTYFDEF